jgi:curved DNA-binding protein
MNAGFKDYYSILGVSRNADEKEIKSAYRRLARKHHPDVNPDNKAAEETFKNISEAYAVLSDKEKRAKYDQFGQHWEQAGAGRQGQGGATGPWDFGGFPFDVGDTQGRGQQYDVSGASGFSDFFEMLFGGGAAGGAGRKRKTAHQHEAPGHNLESEIEITLEDTCQGAKKAFVMNGRRIEVTIPKGIKDGQKIRLANQGAEGVRVRGDLLLRVKIAAHPVFERRENNLYTDIAIDYVDAALGGEMQVPTLTGRVTMKIPPGTSADRTFRLPGQGMPIVKSDSSGDLFARVRIRMPEMLSNEETDLLQQIRKSRQDK